VLYVDVDPFLTVAERFVYSFEFATMVLKVFRISNLFAVTGSRLLFPRPAYRFVTLTKAECWIVHQQGDMPPSTSVSLTVMVDGEHPLRWTAPTNR